MVSISYPFLVRDRDRHGNERFYVRKVGVPKVRLRSVPGSAEFDAEYRDALNAVAEAKPIAPVKREGTWRWLCERYMRSAAFKVLHPSTQNRRLRELQATWTEPRKAGVAECIGDMSVARIDERGVIVLRDRKTGAGLEAANQRLKAIKAVFGWAKESGLIKLNPALGVRSIHVGTEGIHVWSAAEIERYKAVHPPGSKAYLLLMLLLLTGVRRSDVIKLGRQHEGKAPDGSETLTFTMTKNEHRKPVRVTIPLLPELRKVLDMSPTGPLTYMVTAYNKPFTVGGLGVRMKRWCRQAGLPECSSHGLRKAAATVAAENGATEHQLMAMFGWMSPNMARLYTRSAQRDKLAASGMALVVRK
jgi:integrase